MKKALCLLVFLFFLTMPAISVRAQGSVRIGTDPYDPRGDIFGTVKLFFSPQDTRFLTVWVYPSLIVLGLIFFLIVLYAGYLWMTAQGNDEQVKKARTWMTTAVGGLVVVLISLGIARYIVDCSLSALYGQKIGICIF